MNDMSVNASDATIVDSPIVKPPTRAEKVAAWKAANQSAYDAARRACCTCTPTRAQMLLVDQYEGNANIPLD